MDYKCSDGRSSFDLENLADSSKVADMQKAGAGKMNDVIGSFWSKITPKLRTGEVGVNV